MAKRPRRHPRSPLPPKLRSSVAKPAKEPRDFNFKATPQYRIREAGYQAFLRGEPRSAAPPTSDSGE
jgi:hypothetical protein